jgi:hypothetical protein
MLRRDTRLIRFWPKDLPENWTLGQVSGIAVDGQDNVWIVHPSANTGG